MRDVALLAVALGALVYFFRGDFGRLRALAGMAGGAARRWRYRIRIAKSLLLFGGTTLAALAILGRLGALWTMPREFGALAADVGASSDMPLLLVPGILLGSLVGAAWAWWRGRRGKAPAMFGDFSVMLPRDRGEATLAAVAALAAGVSEELYFRLLVPLLVTGVTGSAVVGFAGATALFAAAHRYQRWQGVVATGVAGAMLAAVYLATGRLWIAVALHAVIDLNALVVRPWAGGLLRRRAPSS